MQKTYILTSTQGTKTFMMTSYDLNSFIIFDKPKKEVDANGNTVVYYSSIQILRI